MTSTHTHTYTYTYTCSNGHLSQDEDYCTECGAKMPKAGSTKLGASVAATQTPATSTAPAPATQICPDCGTEQDGAAKFCEVCRHPFTATGGPDSSVLPSAPSPEPLRVTAAAQAPTQAPTQTQASAQTQAPAQAQVSAQVPAQANATVIDPVQAGSSAPQARRFVAVVAVDQQQATEQGAADECPVGRADLRFPLDFNTILIGRSSEQRRIFPELDLQDTGVSHRHLRFERQHDQSFSAVELGSSNGTTFNGQDMKTGTVTPLRAGDVLRLGIWTRITIEEK